MLLVKPLVLLWLCAKGSSVEYSWFDRSDSVETLDEIGAHHERTKTRSSRACRGIALSHFDKLRASPEFIEGTGSSKAILSLFHK